MKTIIHNYINLDEPDQATVKIVGQADVLTKDVIKALHKDREHEVLQKEMDKFMEGDEWTFTDDRVVYSGDAHTEIWSLV